MDWNWFFGALAQCSAAIVGLFGAFLIRDILDSDRSRKSNELHLEDLKKNEKYLITKAKSHEDRINSYKENLIKQVLVYVSKAYRLNHDEMTIDEYTDEFSNLFPIFMDRNDIKHRIAKHINSLGNGDRPTSYTSIEFGARDGVLSRIDEQYASVLELYDQIRAHVMKCRALMYDITCTSFNVKRVKRIIEIVFLLFIVGVILPLLMLPFSNSIIQTYLNTSLLKCILLISITVIVGLLLRKFMEIVDDSKNDSINLARLLEMSTGEHYSPLFNNLHIDW